MKKIQADALGTLKNKLEFMLDKGLPDLLSEPM
jgi:hypothetical protein